MIEILKRVARFLRLIDDNGDLSLTYIAVWVVLFKIATTQNVSIVDAGALFVALLNYSFKKGLKHVSEKKVVLGQEEADLIKQKIKDLTDKVGAIATATSFTKLK